MCMCYSNNLQLYLVSVIRFYEKQKNPLFNRQFFDHLHRLVRQAQKAVVS